MPETPLIDHAEGVHMVDTEGRIYLDGCSGAINANLGHGHPEITTAIHAQIDRVCSAYRRQFGSSALSELSRELRALAPGECASVLYANSGSEAVETAARLSLAYHHERGRPERTLVLTEEPSYHGMTAGALSLSGHPLRRVGIEALLDNGSAGQRVRPKTPGQRADAHDWNRAIQEAGPSRIAAVIVEPVGGAATGAAVPDADTLPALRELADQHGFLLIADEVMTGLGRTGTWFASAAGGAVADLIAVGKGLTAGYATMSAVLVQAGLERELRSPAEDYVFGHTMAGNPLAAATSLAVVRYLRREDITVRVKEMGELLRSRLKSLLGEHPATLEGVRGAGLLQGLALRTSGRTPLASAAGLVQAAQEEGLLLYPSGVDSATESVLVAPALTITEGEVEELVTRLRSTLELFEKRYLNTT
ncbi:aminotransferase family protein [Nocardiopsis salina]|uniref:aminotransferase family protein n=1 Tax=Nocardiopsis salina TaxID=245836 RepID=UPI00034DE198|nr:aminotransferase class III-fold pyridoxal phosphate-dependent enzyme [Nocardiopsis salina]